MARNRGNTSLKCKRRNERPMLEYDQLPQELRVWVASAYLPWRPRSVQKAYDRAMLQTGSNKKALDELSRLQRRLISKDVEKVWGRDHPDAYETTDK